MLFRTPGLTPTLTNGLEELSALRAEIGGRLLGAAPWAGRLRRLARATSAASSTAIEGFSVTPDEALAIVEGDLPSGVSEEDRLAVECYARALDHVAAMNEDAHFRWSGRVILDLHFDACWFQKDKRPGRWRTGPIAVTGGDGRLRYQAPDADDLAGLVAETLDWLAHGDRDVDVAVRAAMAHLHLVSLHPFEDGNGRVSRILQSLVLVRGGTLAAELASIEDYLAAHTSDYYAVLESVQGGRYQPERDATPWVEFCVRAHLDQARGRLDQIRRAGARWSRLERLVESRGWPDRLVIALEQSLIGGTDRARYAAEADVSSASASADLRRLLDAGLVVQQGRGRSTRYTAADALRDDLENPSGSADTP
jgi:Fic family protein